MGVTSLWQIVSPCARPTKIETLNKKRLGVDASIWVYHFLKAVRDKEGNALRNSHIVGFYRRICKLLYLGIRPVFVFDGGAPALKRQTITGRKNRREGRREDAVRTAGKLLALQMQRHAEEEEERRANAPQRPDDEEEAVPDNPVYVDELGMTAQERQASNQRFKKKDQYHLPDLDMPLAEMGGPSDPRVMSLEELQVYAKQFEAGEDINVYDFSKIDFESPFFTSLPATDRYNILNAARLRSRLRMGYSREQLDKMFPDRMAFSRFQIERVRERNELTQRLMRVGTVEDGTFEADMTGRVSGEKGREYVLVKNPDVEGGWALGVIGDKDQEGADASKPIDIEAAERRLVEEQRAADESDNDDDKHGSKDDEEEILRRREAFYKSRLIDRGVDDSAAGEEESELQKAKSPSAEDPEDPEGLFFADKTKAPVQTQQQTDGEESSEESDDEETQLQLAIAMSMENSNSLENVSDLKRREVLDRMEQAQKKAPQSSALANARGKVASIANRQAQRSLTKGRHMDERPRDDDDMDLLRALAKSREDEQQQQQQRPPKKFDGPLPFEKLDLGSSILGKKKMQKLDEDAAGGFEKDDRLDTRKKSAPAPPWFSADVQRGMSSQREALNRTNKQDEEAAQQDDTEFQPLPSLRRKRSNEVIDVDALDDPARSQPKPSLIAIDSSSEDESDAKPDAEPTDFGIQHFGKEDDQVRMGDLADAVRADPPAPSEPPATAEPPVPTDSRPLPLDEVAETTADSKKHMPDRDELNQSPSRAPEKNVKSLEDVAAPAQEPTETPAIPTTAFDDRSDSELSWDASGDEQAPAQPNKSESKRTAVEEESDSDEVSEEEVYVPSEEQMKVMAGEAPPKEQTPEPMTAPADAAADTSTIPMSGTADQTAFPDEEMVDGEDLFSDPEDEELMLNMANEAEEHARFASSFNNRTTAQNIEEYERELKALRNQQKKDRRDADEVTQVMIQECQQLLKLFGLPYITAPMEAEAQCAELVQLGLVDGIVTDDSDIFLFGGTRVYKNMFNQAKFVECYLASDLERDFDLTRDKLINIAHLLGSDYTEGLPGVGPVTAIEILSEFPNGLDDFRSWYEHIQAGNPLSASDQKSPFRRKFKKQTSKLFLPPSFPDRRVDMAYHKPEVDSDPSAFQWGVPNLDALRSFLMATIGWDQARTDEVLVPVIRDMNRRDTEGTQANITTFLGAGSVGAGAFAPRVRDTGKSRRMEAALERLAERARARQKASRSGPGLAGLGGDGGVVDAADADAVVARAGTAVDENEASRPPKKKKRLTTRAETVAVDQDDDDSDEEMNGGDNDASRHDDDENHDSDGQDGDEDEYAARRKQRKPSNRKTPANGNAGTKKRKKPSDAGSKTTTAGRGKCMRTKS